MAAAAAGASRRVTLALGELRHTVGGCTRRYAGSVRGEQWRIKINNSGGGWGVVTAENRFMCQRGPNAGQWVIQPCP